MEDGTETMRSWKHASVYWIPVLALVLGWWGGSAWARRDADREPGRGVTPAYPIAAAEDSAPVEVPARRAIDSTAVDSPVPVSPDAIETVPTAAPDAEVDWLARAHDVVADPGINPDGKTLSSEELLWLAETLQMIHDPPQDLEQLYSAAKKDFAWRLHEQGRSVSLPPGVPPQPHSGVGFAFIVDGETQPIYVNFDPHEDPTTAKYSLVTKAQGSSLSEVLAEYFDGL